ncbi:MAG: gliding motility-associated C-terminal domain-containing protein, partial [Bacteroidia bacterium]|nr:gliding motility-associated C-terminal domain-containing protein [Bacteroidia bacterium]
SYSWDFGTGSFSSFQKNPLKSLNTVLDSILVTHAVRTVSGCVDTIKYYLKIEGPKPYFTIKDTIGCNSLNAVFLNTSRFSTSYIWQFGDSAMQNLQTSQKTPISFLYNKTGRYYISLIGIDTIRNPVTGSIYFCRNIFPDKIYQPEITRSVLVLPYFKTALTGSDSICLGSTAVLKSESDTGYNYDNWSMGDSTNYLRNPGLQLSHVYKKEGTYIVKLLPGYNNPLYNFCRDSAIKKIFVADVKADFKIDSPAVIPVFKFHNLSTPSGAKLQWDFGQPSSGNLNTSAENDPEHNYGSDTGTFMVCLRTSVPPGCEDTVCKPVRITYKKAFRIFNIFTPGITDGKNDSYDIIIEGEDLYDLKIYDRWGVLVFNGNEDAEGIEPGNWNGRIKNKGDECSAGTYYYIFKYSYLQDPSDIKLINGVVTLIR